MKQILARLSGAVPAIARDAIGLSGVGAIIAGMWMIYVPAALIVGGAMLIYVAILLSSRLD